MDTVLWEGKAAVKWGIFGLAKYATITDREIIIRANQKPDSKVIHKIAKEDIISIDPPKYGTTEIMLTGISGYTVKYKDQDKTKSVSFWSSAFGAIIDASEMEKISKALKTLYPNLNESTTAKKDADQYLAYYFGVVGVGLAGFFIFGIIGAVLFFIAALLTMIVVRAEKMSTPVKVLLSVLIWFITLGICGAFIVLYLLSAVYSS